MKRHDFFAKLMQYGESINFRDPIFHLFFKFKNVMPLLFRKTAIKINVVQKSWNYPTWKLPFYSASPWCFSVKYFYVNSVWIMNPTVFCCCYLPSSDRLRLWLFLKWILILVNKFCWYWAHAESEVAILWRKSVMYTFIRLPTTFRSIW